MRKSCTTARHRRFPCVIALLVACAGARHIVTPAPLDAEGALYVEVNAFPQDAQGLEVEIASAAAIRADGVREELALRHDVLSGAPARLGSARLPPGAYSGMLLSFRKATVKSPAGKRDLTVPTEPTQVDAPFVLAAGRAVVLALTLRPGSMPRGAFTPAFGAEPPPQPLPALTGFCTDAGSHDVTTFDKHARTIAGVIPTGRSPWGIALDPVLNRAYVALSGEDEVDAIDLQSGVILARIRLAAGDAPRDLALTPDRRALLSANSGSNTISFIDPSAMIEQGRVGAGQEPTWLLLDRRGVRGYVFNVRSNTVTVVDVAHRAAVATLSIFDRPLRGQLSRDGSRLYVTGPGTPWLTVYSLPNLGLEKRVYVGLGTTGIKVDAATDLLYLARGDENRLAVYDPFSFLPLDYVELPGGGAQMAIDDARNALFVIVPEKRSIAVVDLDTRRIGAVLDVGDDPAVVALMGERQ